MLVRHRAKQRRPAKKGLARSGMVQSGMSRSRVAQSGTAQSGKVEAHTLRDRAGNQFAPASGVRTRPAGRAGGEQHSGRLVCRNDRIFRPGPVIAEARRKAEGADAVLGGRPIGQAVDVRVVLGQLFQQLRRTVRRQQIDLVATQRRRETDGKTVTIGAEVDHITVCRQQAGQRGHIGQKSCRTDRVPVTPGEGCLGPMQAKHWMSDHPTAP